MDAQRADLARELAETVEALVLRLRSVATRNRKLASELELADLAVAAYRLAEQITKRDRIPPGAADAEAGSFRPDSAPPPLPPLHWTSPPEPEVPAERAVDNAGEQPVSIR
jgi:hypothetical protein